MYVETLLKKYSCLDAAHLLTRVSLKGGFLKLPDFTVDEEMKDEYYNSIATDYTKLTFYNWKELFDEISEKIANFNNNETQISRFVYSLLMPFNTISKFLFPSDIKNTELSELSSFLWKYARENFITEEMMEEIRKKADDKFKGTCYTIADRNGNIGNPYLDFIQEETKKIGMTSEYLDHKFLIEIIYVVSRLATAIEGALLINGAQNGLFEYQDKCGVVICRSISAKRLCEHLGWTEKIANSLLPSPISYPEAIKKEPNTGRCRPTGVSEIDDLLECINTGTYQPSEEDLKPILKSFQVKCQEKANSNLSNKEKEVWIARILDALAEIFFEHGADGNYSFSHIAIEFWGCLEAEFLAATEQICVRKVARELNFEQILDTPYNSEDTQYVICDNPDFKKPYSLLYSKLWPNLGLSTHYHEKRICEACTDMSCKYRYGIKNLTGLEKEYASKKYPHSDSIVLLKEAKEETEEGHAVADEQNERNMKPLDTGINDSNSLNPIVMTDDLKKYLSAFAQEGYLDQNYHWIRIKGHTIYHAGWMAKIITYNVPDVTYARIERIIRLSGLIDAASKCVTQNKKTKIAEIDAVCTAHGLSKKTY